jgi:hypothetical protein
MNRLPCLYSVWQRDCMVVAVAKREIEMSNDALTLFFTAILHPDGNQT